MAKSIGKRWLLPFSLGGLCSAQHLRQPIVVRLHALDRRILRQARLLNGIATEQVLRKGQVVVHRRREIERRC
jgi:hypothetical protein